MTRPGDEGMRVRADPEKRFFINMLVKDIELLPAVLDLVDNSVDGARRLRGEGRYDGFHVELEVSSDQFRIADNCGGIALDLARDYAFRFGRPEDFESVSGSVGQFGVGMKRALFKLGGEFLIDSRSDGSRFVLHVDVNEWAQEPGSDWSFTLSEVDDEYTPAGPDGVGTEILVGPLHASVSEDFGSSQTLGSLRYQLRLRHREAMERGLRITLNGEHVIPFLPQLQSSSLINPLHRTLSIDEDSGVVHVRIYAGVVSSGKSSPVEDDRGEDFRTEPDAGWYVFCNNRLLIAADRTSLTGWGNGMPLYHPQYRQFRGYVFIDSAQSDLLPWNTTKTGVDRDSRVWRRVFSDMVQAGTEVIRMLNIVKTERETAESGIDLPVSEAISTARPVALREIEPSRRLSYPTPLQPATRPDTRKIQYAVERWRYDRVAEVLGTSTVAEVGRQTFDYFYAKQVDEDE